MRKHSFSFHGVGQYRFTAAVARAGLNRDYAMNQPCGSPATQEQSVDGATVQFQCDTPQRARYVSLDIDPSSPGVTNALLQLGEVIVEEDTDVGCPSYCRKIMLTTRLVFGRIFVLACPLI